MTKSGQSKETFVVELCNTQNSTWQGKVTWAELQQTRSFRSALELLKLMENALDYQNQTKSQDRAKEERVLSGK